MKILQQIRSCQRIDIKREAIEKKNKDEAQVKKKGKQLRKRSRGKSGKTVHSSKIWWNQRRRFFKQKRG